MDYFASNGYGQETIRVPISELCFGHGMNSEVLIGIVATKQTPRSFQGSTEKAKNGESNGTRQVFSFLLRDSARDGINVTVWGSEEFISALAASFTITDIVEISNFKVQDTREGDQKFNPTTNIRFCIHISEQNQGNITLYSGPLAPTLANLAKVPTCRSDDYYSLKDIMSGDQSVVGQSVNLLAGVLKVGALEELTSKSGKVLRKVELVVCDDQGNMMGLTVWNTDACNSGWQELSTVLFAVDVRVSFNEYRKKIVASSTSKTVFCLNPDIKEACALFKYMQETPDLQHVPIDNHTQQQISMMTLSEAKSLLVEGCNEKVSVIAAITQFDIDVGDLSKRIKYVCASCNGWVRTSDAICTNSACENATNGQINTTRNYDIRISLSDHTATTDYCKLSSDVAEKMLGMKLEQYLQLRGEQLTNLKWKWLLERVSCILKLYVGQTGNSSIRVDACELASPEILLDKSG